jgi:hypothetical protein
MSLEMVKVLRCVIRTVGILSLVALVIWSKKYLGWEWTYEDTRVVLGIVNNYGPEITGLLLFAGNGYIVYTASKADNDFHFVHFFMEGRPENLYRFGYWLFAQAGIWSIVAMYWRDKLDAAFWLTIGGIFVGERAINSIGHHFGKKGGSDASSDSGNPVGGGTGRRGAK